MRSPTGLHGLRVTMFEARRAHEFASLIQKRGGQPCVVPSVVEAPLGFGPELREGVRRLKAGEVSVYCVLTGAGQRKLVELVKPELSAEALARLLAPVVVAARGSKSVSALREIGCEPQVVAPPPHTFRELFAALSAQFRLAGAVVALQQYGAPHERLTRALHAAGASVLQLPVYRWQLPEDCARLEAAVERIAAGQTDVVLFTAGPQLGALMEVARAMGAETRLRQGLARVALGSIGPSCSETLRGFGLAPDFEPDQGKMGHLVRKAAEVAGEVLAEKRRD